MRLDVRNLTKRQSQVLEFVRTRTDETGSAPTLDEIRQHFRFKSSNSVRQHLRLIAQKGFLNRRPHRARGIQVVRDELDEHDVVRIPLLGRIAAGKAISVVEHIEATIPQPRGFWRGDSLFALRVRGDSMVGAGIFDGDIAIVNAQSEIPHGRIAAVVIDEDSTLKRIFVSQTGIRLHAENPAYDDLFFRHADAGAIRVAGVLVGTLRSFDNGLL